MKTKIIKELYAEMILGDKTFRGEFLPLVGSATQKTLGGFHFGKEYWSIVERFKGVQLLDNGNILIKYQYQFAEQREKYEVVDFVLEPDKVLIIDDDKIGHWSEDKRKQETEDVVFKFYLHYEEVEINENELVLQFHEKASDSWGETYINGDECWGMPVKLGSKTESRLIKEEKIEYIITKIDGLNIELECRGEYQTDRYPSVNINKASLNQYYFMHSNSSGGFNTRYDYESWHRSMDIRLKIDNAIMLKRE